MSKLKWLGVLLLFLIIFKECIAGIYLIPSSSMLPVLFPGDRIVVNKLAYNLKIPFINYPLFTWKLPSRGDMVLFSFANKSELYVKRVIGLPGDYITFREGQVFIEQKPLELASLQNSFNSELKLYEEKNPQFFKNSHFIYLSKEPADTFFETRRFLVPPGKLFVLGDNRDNSMDSRVYGYVDISQVLGQTSYILYSTTGKSWYPSFRKNRIFLDMGAKSD